MSSKYSILIPEKTKSSAQKYLQSLLRNKSTPGYFLRERLVNHELQTLTNIDLIGLLFDTRKPQIFAESQVLGNGIDWNLQELKLLGDISVAAQVTIFDNGHHTEPTIHQPPFKGTLIFTAGALLRNDSGFPPADWQEVIRFNRINKRAYCRLYERRWRPIFDYINQNATETKPALVTIPGIGCGQFAGKFHGQVGSHLQTALRKFLKTYGKRYKNIKVVYFDPYSECSDSQEQIHGIKFLTRPLKQVGELARSQLSRPTSFMVKKIDLTSLQLFSLVAWDHVSWPGNDFYVNSRGTDDGVKSAATNAMTVFTGVEGYYCHQQHKYLPPQLYSNWEQVVMERLKNNQIRLWH